MALLRHNLPCFEAWVQALRRLRGTCRCVLLTNLVMQAVLSRVRVQERLYVSKCKYYADVVVVVGCKVGDALGRTLCVVCFGLTVAICLFCCLLRLDCRGLLVVQSMLLHKMIQYLLGAEIAHELQRQAYEGRQVITRSQLKSMSDKLCARDI